MRRLVSLSVALPTHPGPLQRTLPRTGDAVRSRIEALSARLQGDPLGPLFTALRKPDGPERDAELNEALDDLDRRLAGGPSARGAYLRVYAFGGVFVTTVAVLVGGATAASLVANGLPVAGLTAVAAWSFWLVERGSGHVAREVRGDLDALVEHALARTGAPPELFSREDPAPLRGGNQGRRGRR